MTAKPQSCVTATLPRLFAHFKRTTTVLLLWAFSYCAYADVSGVVFRDLPVDGDSLNTYGVRDANESGVAGIEVIVTGDNGTTETVQTGVDGSWTTTAGGFGSEVKVEFTTIPAYLASSPQGANSRTTVQFVADGASNVDLGLHNPENFSELNPLVTTTLLISGDQSSHTPAIEAQDYRRTGAVQHVAYADSGNGLGAVWGLAYNKNTSVLFSSAVLRRHVGLGSEGLGGIYAIDYSAGTGAGTLLTPIDLAALGVDVGTDPRTTALPSDPDDPSHDEKAYPLIGKLGIGDIDVSEDGNTLYAMNLKEKALVALDISDLSAVSLAGAPVAIPDPGCSNGEHRPWAIDVHDGEVYVGMVCDGSAGGSKDDLHLYVQRLNGTAFDPVYDVVLNHDRTGDYFNTNSGGSVGGNGTGIWHIWDDVWATQFATQKYRYGQPMLGDIEFDVDGSLILHLVSRNALRTGYLNYSNDVNDTRTVTGRNSGDVMRVCHVSGTYVLEGGAGCAFNFTGNAHKNFNAGEYYMDNSTMTPDTNSHTESHIGGGALLPGSGELVTATQTGFNSGGFNWYDNSSGEKIAQVPLYDVDTVGGMAKAAGIGDIELLSAPAPVQVGNRVWADTNSDGLQDAGETGLAGVEVTLSCGADTATVITTGEGEYYFDNDPAGAANALFMAAGESCSVSVAAGQAVLSAYALTVQNAGGDSSNDPKTDLHDSDASDNNGTAEITFTAGNAGENNHTLDFGFTDEPVLPATCEAANGDFGGTVFRDYNENGQHDLLEPGLAGVTVTAYDAGNNPVSTAVSNTRGDYVLAGVVDGTDYRIEFTNLPDDVRSGSQGADSHTTVRFETAAAQCTVDLGVNNPAQYCQVAPEITTSLFREGDHATGTYNNTDALISVNAGWGQYATGNDANPPTADLSFWQPAGMQPRSLAVMSQLGSTYGLAWSQNSNHLYAAAYQKSHTDFGPGGRGQIYRIAMNPLTGQADAAPEQWVNIETDLGVTVCGGHGVDLNGAYDQAIFDQVGKCSLGDLDISEDESTLFVMNLTTKEVIGIDTNTQAKTGQWAFPTNQLSCANAPNDVRPFALKYRNGKLYAGGVCSGETGRNKANLRAYVYSLDTTTGAWTSELEYDWSKQRRAWYGTQLDAWMTDIDQAHQGRFSQGNPKNWVTDNSQMLTDIEFVGNDMILGFRGRFSDQWGVEIEYERTTPTTVAKANYTANTVGDIVCAGYDVATGSYAWETNDHTNNLGVCGGRTASTPGYIHSDTDYDPDPAADPKFRDDDLDDGEFYWGDGGAPSLGNARHYEISMGGLAQYGTEPVIMSALTPPNALGVGYDQSAGFVWLDNNTGAPRSAYVVYDENDAGTFNKSSGLGDVEALCLPAPVEVGNRVWLDSNENGIQDPGEAGVDGVDVTLSCGVDTATVTTAAGGEYYFDNDPDGAANALFMDFGESCSVSIAAGQAALSAYALTTQNADGDTSNDPGTDLRDSDASDNNGTAEITFTAGNAGENNHTLDFGYKAAPQVDLELTKTVDKTTVLRGDTVIYTLTATNESGNAATGVQVTDKLPAELEFIGAAGNGTYTSADGLWVIGDLAAGASAVLTITVTVK